VGEFDDDLSVFVFEKDVVAFFEAFFPDPVYRQGECVGVVALFDDLSFHGRGKAGFYLNIAIFRQYSY